MLRNVERTLIVGTLGLAGIGATVATVQKTRGLHVCVATDRTIRYEPSAQCPAGQASYQLVDVRDLGAAAGSGGGNAANESEQVAELKAKFDATQSRLNALESYIADVNKRGGAHRITAPFQVDDDKGNPIFVIATAPRGFQLYHPSGKTVAAGTVFGDGAFFKVFTLSDTREAVMGATGGVSLLDVRQGQDKSGVKLAVAQDNVPTALIFNASNIPVAALTHGKGGAGLLQLGDPAGNTMVDAGTLVSGVGQVQTYPSSCPAGGGLIAPTCVRGSKRK